MSQVIGSRERALQAMGLTEEELENMQPDTPQADNDDGTYMSSLKRGAHQLGATVYGAAGLVGDALGNEEIADWGLEGYQRKMADAAEYAPEVGSFTNINSLDDLGTWTVEALGELTPTALSMLVPGGVLAKAGEVGAKKLISKGVMKLAKDQVEKLGEKKAAQLVAAQFAKRMGQVGVGAVSGGVESGGMWGEDAERRVAEGGSATDANAGSAAAFGALNAALEVAVGADSRILSKIVGKKELGKTAKEASQNFVKVLMKEAPKTLAGEFTTESAQELSNYLNRKYNFDDPFTPEELIGIVDAGLKGAVGGAAFAVPSAVAEGRANKQMLQGREAQFAANHQALQPVVEQLAPTEAEAAAAEIAANAPAVAPNDRDQLVPERMKVTEAEAATQQAEARVAYLKEALATAQKPQDKLYFENQLKKADIDRASIAAEAAKARDAFDKARQERDPQYQYEQRILEEQKKEEERLKQEQINARRKEFEQARQQQPGPQLTPQTQFTLDAPNRPGPHVDRIGPNARAEFEQARAQQPGPTVVPQGLPLPEQFAAREQQLAAQRAPGNLAAQHQAVAPEFAAREQQNARAAQAERQSGQMMEQLSAAVVKDPIGMGQWIFSHDEQTAHAIVDSISNEAAEALHIALQPSNVQRTINPETAQAQRQQQLGSQHRARTKAPAPAKAPTLAEQLQSPEHDLATSEQQAPDWKGPVSERLRGSDKKRYSDLEKRRDRYVTKKNMAKTPQEKANWSLKVNEVQTEMDQILDRTIDPDHGKAVELKNGPDSIRTFSKKKGKKSEKSQTEAKVQEKDSKAANASQLTETEQEQAIHEGATAKLRDTKAKKPEKKVTPISAERKGEIKKAFPNAVHVKPAGEKAAFVDLPNGETILVLDDSVLLPGADPDAVAEFSGAGGVVEKQLGIKLNGNGVLQLTNGVKLDEHGQPVLEHEAIHAAINMALSDRQVATLKREFGGDEEAVVEAYAKWQKDNTSQKGGIRLIFKAVADFWKRVAINLFGTAEARTKQANRDTFADIKSGEVWYQEARSGNLSTVPEDPRTFSIHTHEQWKERVGKELKAQGVPAKVIDKYLKDADARLVMITALAGNNKTVFPEGPRGKDMAKSGVKGARGPLRKNSDDLYKISFDLTGMCVKRLEFGENINELTKLIGRAPNVHEQMVMKLAMKNKGKTAPCLYCYVEAPRAMYATQLDRFTRMAFGDEDFSSQKEVTQKEIREAGKELRAAGIAYKDIDQRYFIDPDYKAKMDADPEFILHKAPRYKQLAHKFANAASSQNKPKVYEDYSGQILDLDQKLIDELNSKAGIRFQSVSDFQIEHVLDLMQAVHDLGVRGARSHVYTKVPEFVEIFGDTGMKVQTSIFAKENKAVKADLASFADKMKKKRGKDWRFAMTKAEEKQYLSILDKLYRQDTFMGMDWVKARQFRKAHENVGTILVAQDEDVLRWGLNTPWVDYVIPFHSSGMSKAQVEALGWQNFTSGQTEKLGSNPRKSTHVVRGDVVDFSKGVTNEDFAAAYLKHCDDNDIIPVFKEYRNHPGYAKLIKDFSRTDTPFNVAEPKFNMDKANKLLKDWVKKGGNPKADMATVNEVADMLEGKDAEQLSLEMLGDSATGIGTLPRTFAKRTKPDPKKTVTAYKLFRVNEKRPGELFPLFVPMNEGASKGYEPSIPMNEWQDAEEGLSAGKTKTGRAQVKSKLGPLAYRPGFHAGDLPLATHIGAKSQKGLKAPDTRPENQVWAEVEMAADVDWQEEANKRGINAKGKFIAREAQITDQMPVDGYYKYKTNSNMTGSWLIGGAMKINRILSDEEVDKINSKAGTADLKREKPFDKEKYGFKEVERTFAKAQAFGGHKIMDENPDSAGVLTKVGFQKNLTPTQRLVDLWHGVTKDWKTKVFDRLNPQLEAEKLAAAQTGREWNAEESGYIAWRLISSLPEILSSVFTHGSPTWLDKDGKHTGVVNVHTENDGILTHLKKLGDDLDYFMLWKVGKRAKKLMAEGRENLLTQADLDEIDALVADRRNTNRELWDEVDKAYQKAQKGLLDFAIESGILNDEQVEAWHHAEYLPFYRVKEDGSAVTPHSARNKIDAAIKELKGGEGKLNDPLENIIRNYHHLVEQSVKNDAMRKSLAYLEEIGVAKLVPKARNDGNYVTVRGTLVKKDGTEHEAARLVYKVEDTALFEMLTNADLNRVQNFMGMKMLSKAKRVLTAGATFGPAFRIRNFLRDTLHTAIIQKNFTAFSDSFRGFAKAWNNSEEMKQLRAAGGAFDSGYIQGNDPYAVARYLRKEVKGGNSWVPTPIRKLAEFWEKTGAAAENAARVQLFSNLMEDGMSQKEAAYKAKDLLDFSMRGSSGTMQVAIQMVPFMGARIQGLYKLGREMGPGAENAQAAWLKGGMLMGLTAGLWAFNKANNSDEWDELADEDKWLNFHFWVGDQHFRIPKPFEVGALFSGSIETMLDGTAGSREFGHISDFAMFTLLETLSMNPTPQLAKPLIDQWANKNSFTGRPIIGYAMQRLDAAEQYDPWTSEFWRAWAGAMPDWAPDMMRSPKRLERLTLDYFSTLGEFSMFFLDHGTQMIGGFPAPPAPTTQDMVGIGSFVRDQTPRNTRYVKEFYEALRESEVAVSTLKHYQTSGEPQKAAEYLEDHAQEIRSKKALSKISKQLSALNKQSKLIYKQKGLTPEQKREKLDAILKRRNQIVWTAWDRLIRTK